MRAQSEFTDYDFEGSALSNLLDVLAYNTYYTAFNTNMVANEFFLESATLRDNVVRIAKQLGYSPRSKVASTTKISFTASITDTNPPKSYILKKGTGFVTNFDSSIYNYVTVDDITVPVANSIATFTDVDVYEGTLVTEYFTFNESESNRFILKNQNIDVSSIRVNVFENENTTSKIVFNAESNILNVDSQSRIFFIEEVDDERYEIIFGDGVFGVSLTDQNYIEVSYLITNGSDVNGARSFRFTGLLVDTDNFTYNSDIVITNESVSDGGAEMESSEEIKYSAPKYFATQNRAVTAEDFKSIVGKIYPNIADIIVYGGEDESPPEYGVVNIVIKPKNSVRLGAAAKLNIISELQDYMVASVRPQIKNPSVLYVEILSDVYYSKNLTNLTSKDISSRVSKAVEDYIQLSETEKFSGKLRYSKINAVIDNSDVSIQSNITSFTMRKDINPILNTTSYYEVCYQNEFDKDCEGATVQSTGFVVQEYPRFTVYVRDNDGTMILYRVGENGDIILNNDIGTVDYIKGEVKLYDLTIIKGSFDNNFIELRVVPSKKDIFAFREQYLDVDISKSTFIARAE